MPADVRNEAEQLLAAPDLLERIVADIEALGVVGERSLAMTLYLIGTSAQLPKPVSGIVRGSSSSGKSFAVGQVGLLFPEEIVLHATSLTTNSLYYFEPGTLRHRFVVAGERSRLEDDSTAEATRALREMIESGRLSKAVPVKEGDRMVTRVLEQDGPIAYVETTTLTSIFEEDANRCLLLSTNEHEEQTRRILKATAAAAAGKAPPHQERRRAVHFAVQRMIPRVDVQIPFAPYIAERYPTARLDARRSFRHLLCLTKAVALLHFLQRERGSCGEVIATIDDYAVAVRLAAGPLGTAACGISDGARAYLRALKSAFGGSVFTTTDAQKVGEGSRRTRYSRLSELNTGGAVEQTEAGRGKVPAKWQLTGFDPAEGSGTIPRPEDVSHAFTDCARAHES